MDEFKARALDEPKCRWASAIGTRVPETTAANSRLTLFVGLQTFDSLLDANLRLNFCPDDRLYYCLPMNPKCLLANILISANCAWTKVA